MRCGSVNEVRSTVFAALSGFCLVALLCSCFEEEESEQAKRSEGNALDRRERIRQLELDVETLKWENARLFLKIRSVDGSSLVRDKLTGLWHFDVRTHSLHGTSNGKLLRRVTQSGGFLPQGEKRWSGEILVCEWSFERGKPMV